MDVSHMDTPTARLVITFGLEDVTDTIIKITGADDAKLNPVDEAQLRGLETLRQTLENQLEMLDQDQAVNDSKDNMILDEPNDVNDLGSGDESFSSVGSPFDEVTDEEDVTGEKINLNGTTDRESDHDEYESIVVRDYLECPNCSNSWFEEDAPKFCAKCLTNSHEFLSVFDGEKMPRELVPKEKDTPRKKAILERRIQCMACEDYVPIKSTEQLKCEPESHVYCHACLHDIVRSALYTDTSLFPPRCCNKPIPIEICRQVFPPSKAAEFEMRFERLSMANPTDCYNCMQFVPAGNIVADVAVCAHCAARTCIACKAQKHDGLCKEDPYVKLLSATASEYKWQTCRKCKNMVELDIGCFHMVCRCSHQFCYLCGADWRTCRCPQFAEDHILLPRPGDLARKKKDEADRRAIKSDPAAFCDGHLWVSNSDKECGDCGMCVSNMRRCVNCKVRRCWRCVEKLS